MPPNHMNTQTGKAYCCFGILIFLVFLLIFIIIKSVKRKGKRRPFIVLPEDKETQHGKSLGRLGIFTDAPQVNMAPEDGFVGFLDMPNSSLSSLSTYHDATERSKTPFESGKSNVPTMIYPWALRLSQLTIIDAQLNRNTNPWSLHHVKKT